MDIAQARQLAANIPEHQRAALAAAHERYMYFTGVYADTATVDQIAQDRAAFPHLLKFTADGRPSLSDERCAEFIAAVTGLPREWCLAWEEIEFVNEHGEGFFEKQLRRQEIDRLAAPHMEHRA